MFFASNNANLAAECSADFFSLVNKCPSRATLFGVVFRVTGPCTCRKPLGHNNNVVPLKTRAAVGYTFANIGKSINCDAHPPLCNASSCILTSPFGRIRLFRDAGHGQKYRDGEEERNGICSRLRQPCRIPIKTLGIPETLSPRKQVHLLSDFHISGKLELH